MAIGWSEYGNLADYASREEIRLQMSEVLGEEGSFMNDTLAMWQFVHDLKPGDVIFVKQGRQKILGRGVVLGNYEYNADAGDYPNIRKVQWTHKGTWLNNGQFAMKTLTDVTDYVDFCQAQ